MAATYNCKLSSSLRHNSNDSCLHSKDKIRRLSFVDRFPCPREVTIQVKNWKKKGLFDDYITRASWSTRENKKADGKVGAVLFWKDFQMDWRVEGPGGGHLRQKGIHQFLTGIRKRRPGQPMRRWSACLPSITSTTMSPTQSNWAGPQRALERMM